jgi:hypothetical protein
VTVVTVDVRGAEPGIAIRTPKCWRLRLLGVSIVTAAW